MGCRRRAPIAREALKLPVTNLALKAPGRLLADVTDAPELADPALGGSRRCSTWARGPSWPFRSSSSGAKSASSGFIAVSRDRGRRPTSLAEAVTREVGLAIHTAQLLEENRKRLDRQAALVQAAQAMAKLRVETVLQRLVVEVTKLLDVDAADCYLYDARRGVPAAPRWQPPRS